MQQSAGRRFPGRLPRSDALVLDAAPVKHRVEGIELGGVAVRETVAVPAESSLDRLVTDSLLDRIEIQADQPSPSSRRGRT
jgi:hypothetical protein